MNLFSRLTRPKPSPVPVCAACAAQLDHCHDTLVVHADGRAECDGADACDADEALHRLWVACPDLGCACTGEEHELHLAA